MDDTPQVQALAETFDAAGRLAERGLAVNNDTAGNNEATRGLNNAGLQTLGDLLTVLMLQTASSTNTTERLAGQCARVMLNTLAALYADLGGARELPDLQRKAIRELRLTAKNWKY